MRIIQYKSFFKAIGKNAKTFLGMIAIVFSLCFILIPLYSEYQSIFPLVLSLMLFYTKDIFEDKLQYQVVKQLSILSLFVFITLFFDYSLWIKVGFSNLLFVLYILFFVHPLLSTKINSKIFREFVFFTSVLFTLDTLLLNIQYFNFLKSFALVDGLLNYLNFLLDVFEVTLLVTTIVVSSYKSLNSKQDKGDDVLDENTLQGSNLTINEKNLTPDNQSQIARSLIAFFQTSDLYLKSDFNSKHLSREIGLTNHDVVSDITELFFGLTFKEVVAKYRIAYAMSLLKDKRNLSIALACEKAGFKSMTTFNKYFVQYVGVTAAVYKNKISN